MELVGLLAHVILALLPFFVVAICDGLPNRHETFVITRVIIVNPIGHVLRQDSERVGANEQHAAVGDSSKASELLVLLMHLVVDVELLALFQFLDGNDGFISSNIPANDLAVKGA